MFTLFDFFAFLLPQIVHDGVDIDARQHLLINESELKKISTRSVKSSGSGRTEQSCEWQPKGERKVEREKRRKSEVNTLLKNNY